MNKLYVKLFLAIILVSGVVYYTHADSATADTMRIECNYSGGTGPSICSSSGNNVNIRTCTVTEPGGGAGDCLYEGNVVCKVLTSCECPFGGDSGPDFCSVGGLTEKTTIAYTVDWDGNQDDCECLGMTWLVLTSRCCGDDGGLEGDDDCYQDVGLRVRDAGVSIPIAVYRSGTADSPVKIQDAGTIYGVGLVPVGHAKASRVHIRLPGNGTVALREYS